MIITLQCMAMRVYGHGKSTLRFRLFFFLLFLLLRVPFELSNLNPSSLLKAQLAFASSQATEKVKRKTQMARVFMVLSRVVRSKRRQHPWIKGDTWMMWSRLFSWMELGSQDITPAAWLLCIMALFSSARNSGGY